MGLLGGCRVEGAHDGGTERYVIDELIGVKRNLLLMMFQLMQIFDSIVVL